jgi:hypothetical protein
MEKTKELTQKLNQPFEAKVDIPRIRSIPTSEILKKWKGPNGSPESLFVLSVNFLKNNFKLICVGCIFN